MAFRGILHVVPYYDLKNENRRLGARRFQRAWLQSKGQRTKPGALEATRTQGYSNEQYDRRLLAGPALQHANAENKTRFHTRGYARAGFRHRGEHGDFQCHDDSACAATALQGARVAGLSVE